MKPDPRLPLPDDLPFTPDGREADSVARAVKNVRYIVASVNEDALEAWADLWQQLKDGVTPAGQVLPAMEQQGFKPACGWPAFLEKFWLLKHYLDYIHRFCTTPPSPS